jgi:uncharacterized protein with HEPN domain
MAPRDFRDFLNDMISACQSMQQFISRMTLDEFLADEKTRFAVCRCYEILGEAVRHLPAVLKDAHPDISWATMVAVRNRIVHGYFGIDDTILFTTIGGEMETLLPQLISLRDGLGDRR